MARFIVSLTLALAFLPRRRAPGPTIDDLLNLKSIGGPQISPDGARIVYTQTEADFAQDAFVTQLWMADVKSGQTTQLTRGQKSSTDHSGRPMGSGSRSPRHASTTRISCS